MKLVLDTNALWHRPLTNVLARAHEQGLQDVGDVEVLVPAIVYAERMRQLQGDEPRVALFNRLLSDVAARVEPFTVDEAERLGDRAPSDRLWRGHARDLLIATHVHGERVVITDDGRPPWEGLDRLTPGEATEVVEAVVG